MSLQIKHRPSILVRNNPFFGFQTDLDKMFNHFLQDPFYENGLRKRSNWDVQIDLKETPKEFILTADLPGFNKKDINVTFNNNTLILKGERKVEETKNDEKYRYMERSFGSFERHFRIDQNLIDTEKGISAKLENGVLTLSLAKKEEVKNIKTIEIE